MCQWVADPFRLQQSQQLRRPPGSFSRTRSLHSGLQQTRFRSPVVRRWCCHAAASTAADRSMMRRRSYRCQRRCLLLFFSPLTSSAADRCRASATGDRRQTFPSSRTTDTSRTCRPAAGRRHVPRYTVQSGNIADTDWTDIAGPHPTGA